MTSDETGAAASGDDTAHRLILRGGGSAAVGLTLRLAARLLFLFVAARLFGATLFGAYSLAIAVVELWVAVGGLGMKRLIFKLLDEDRSGRPSAHILLDAAILVGAASFLLAAAVMLIVALPPLYRLGGETAAALLLVAPMIAGQALLDLFLAATRWTHKMRHEVVARSLVEPYAAVAAAAVAWYAGFEATGLLVSYWVGTLFALIYAVAGARRCFGGFGLRSYRMPRGRGRAILREGALPTLIDLVSALFTRIDLYLVGLFMGEGPAGIYGIARQIRTPIRQIRQSFDGMLTPIVAKTLAARGPAETGMAVASASRLILALQLPVLVGLAVIGLPLLHWFGPEFAAGYWALVFLAAAETIQGAFGISDLIFLYRQPGAVLRITLVTIAVNLGAGALLIWRWGIDGAGIAVFVAILAGAIVRRLSLRGLFGIEVPLRYSGGPVIAAAAALGAAFLIAKALMPASEWLVTGASLAAALLVYGGALKLWLLVTGESLALVKFRTD